MLVAAKYLGLESLYNRFMERGLESASPININAEVSEGRPQNEKRKQDSLPTVAKKAKVSISESNPTIKSTTHLANNSCLKRKAVKQTGSYRYKQDIPVACYSGNTPSWQKEEEFSRDQYKQNIPSATCYISHDTSSWPTKEEKDDACYNDNPSLPLEEKKTSDYNKQSISAIEISSGCPNSDLPREEEMTVLYKQEILSAACYSDSTQNQPKEVRKQTDNNESAGFLSPNATPLLFFYDCESTGGNVHEDHIIEIAAEVIGPSKPFISVKSFSEFCDTPYSILGIGCGVTEDMLMDQRKFSEVFPDFLSWINKCIKEAKKATGKPFYPVLVAHNGFVFDFRILAAEVERRNLELQFNRADLGFADTLYELQKMRKAHDPFLSDWSPQERRRLSMSNLHKKYFPGQNHFSTHRALEDVQMMIKLFTTSQLSKVLQSLTMRSTSEIMSVWKNKHEAYTARNM